MQEKASSLEHITSPPSFLGGAAEHGGAIKTLTGLERGGGNDPSIAAFLWRFSEQKNGALIKPKRTVDPHDTLTPAAEKIVRRGEAQLKRGESKPWREVKDALPR
jgi:hypothetical protein